MPSHITLIFLPFSRIFSLNICQVRDSPNLFFFCAARKSLIWFHNYFKSDTAACLFSSRSEIYSKATISRRPAVFSWIALFSVGFVNRSNCCLFNKLKKTLFQKAVKRHDLFTAKKWFLVHTTKAWRWGEAEHGIFRAFLVRMHRKQPYIKETLLIVHVRKRCRLLFKAGLFKFKEHFRAELKESQWRRNLHLDGIYYDFYVINDKTTFRTASKSQP